MPFSQTNPISIMKTFKKTITAADIRIHHIDSHQYSTDMEYVRVARDLQKLIRKNTSPDSFDNSFVETLAINLTLHLEDTVADAGLWRSFCMEHHRLYGKCLPFGWGDTDMPIDEVTVDSCKFIVWMTISNIDDWRHTNPMMPAINNIAELVYGYLNSVFEDISINEEMLEDIYGEHPDDEFFRIRQVLEWIANDSYLSDWDVTRDILKEHCKKLESTFSNLGDHAKLYGARAMSAFGSKVGPLALLPQQWYATMLRTHEDKNCNKKASAVAAMEPSRFDAYHIEGETEKSIDVIGVDGRKYAIDRDSIGFSFGEKPSETNLLIGMFVRYNDKWMINGMTSITSSPMNFKDAMKEYRENTEGHERAIDYFEKYVASHKGRRLYYFDNMPSMVQWLKEDIKFKGTDGLVKSMPDFMKEGERIIVFLPTDGDPEFAVYNAEVIKDPNNPYYDVDLCHENGTQLIDAVDCLRSECIHYMIDHGMLSEVRYSDVDEERGHKIYQQNIDFIARFMRRAGY